MPTPCHSPQPQNDDHHPPASTPPPLAPKLLHTLNTARGTHRRTHLSPWSSFLLPRPRAVRSPGPGHCAMGFLSLRMASDLPPDRPRPGVGRGSRAWISLHLPKEKRQTLNGLYNLVSKVPSRIFINCGGEKRLKR